MPNHIKHLSRPTWWQSRPLQSLLQTLPRTLHTAPQTNQQPPPRPSSASRANLDTSTPPRAQKTNGKSSSRKPRGDIAPTGIWGLGPVTLAFALVVLSGAGWFGYRWYRLTSIYPAPIRASLRAGIAAMLKQDYQSAEAAFRRALHLAHQLPPSSISSDPYLKLSGISTKLGECLEASGKKREAYIVYMQSLAEAFPQFNIYDDGGQGVNLSDENGTLREDKSFKKDPRHPDWKKIQLDGKARLRAVGLANRAAILAEGLARNPMQNMAPPVSVTSGNDGTVGWASNWSDIEMYLRTFSVTQILYLTSHTTGIPTHMLSTSSELDYRLPKWLTRLDLAAPCEGLAEAYVRRGQIELALPLYQTTYHFLLPPSHATDNTRLNGVISTTEALPQGSTSSSDPSIVCMAASVLTAMASATMGVENAGRVMTPTFPIRHSSSAGHLSSSSPRESEEKKKHIIAVRSWLREARRLVDLGRRVHGRGDWARLLSGIEVLGRETESSKNSSVSTSASTFTDGDKDLRLVALDLDRIKEANRRRKEASVELRRKEGKGGTWGDENSAQVGNPYCERTWAAVLFNTGMVEAVGGNRGVAEEYLQLALEQSRRINFMEGVERCKSALREVMNEKQ